MVTISRFYDTGTLNLLRPPQSAHLSCTPFPELSKAPDPNPEDIPQSLLPVFFPGKWTLNYPSCWTTMKTQGLGLLQLGHHTPPPPLEISGQVHRVPGPVSELREALTATQRTARFPVDHTAQQLSHPRRGRVPGKN